MPHRVVLVGVVIAGLALFASIMPLISAQTFFCTDCCRRREQITYLLLFTSNSECSTRRSEWYSRRIARAHEHNWLLAEQVRSSLFFEISCTKKELPERFAQFQAIERLEPLGLDLPVFRHLSSGSKHERSAIGDALHALNSSWDDGKVKRWWSLVEEFMMRPDDWQKGYEKFTLEHGAR